MTALCSVTCTQTERVCGERERDTHTKQNKHTQPTLAELLAYTGSTPQRPGDPNSASDLPGMGRLAPHQVSSYEPAHMHGQASMPSGLSTLPSTPLHTQQVEMNGRWVPGPAAAAAARAVVLGNSAGSTVATGSAGGVSQHEQAVQMSQMGSPQHLNSEIQPMQQQGTMVGQHANMDPQSPYKSQSVQQSMSPMHQQQQGQQQQHSMARTSDFSTSDKDRNSRNSGLPTPFNSPELGLHDMMPSISLSAGM